VHATAGPVGIPATPSNLTVDWDSFLVSQLLAKFANIDALSCQKYLSLP